MFYNNLLFFLVAIVVFSTQTPGEKPWLPPLIALALLLAALVMLSTLADRFFARATDPADYFIAEKRAQLVALSLFVGFVYLLDLKYYLGPLSWGGRLPAATDLAGLTCFFLLLAVIWRTARARYEQLFHRRHTTWGFIGANIKANLPMVLPWLVLSLTFDFLSLLPLPGLQQVLRSPWGEVVFLGLFVIFLLLFFPPLVRWLWGCTPLPPGPVRDHLVRFCRRQGFDSPVLLWPLFEGQALTAAILGVVPGLRYLLVTPALLDALSPDELDSVLAHEIGHVKRRHLLWYVALFLGFSLLAGVVAQFLPHLVLSGDFFYRLLHLLPARPETLLSILVALPLLALMLFSFRFIFGYFIRHFERQADQHVFVAQGTGRPLAAAFATITRLGGGRREEKNWHHFGMGERIDYLARCERDRGEIRRQDRKVRLSLAMYFLLVMTLVLGLRQIDIEGLSDDYQVRYTEAVLLHRERLEPANHLWPTLLGDFLHSRQLERRAVTAYERALPLSPDHAEVRNNLAWLLLTAQDHTLRDPQRALELAQAAAALQEHGSILDTLAVAYWANGKIEEAVLTERRAIRLDPRNQGYYQQQIERFKNERWDHAP